MKIKRALAIAIFLVMTVVFSSCGSMHLVNTVDSLLTPPLYYTEYEGLVDAFNEFAESNPVLITPSTGDYASAITVDDFDNDGEKEAIVLYRANQTDTFASVCFLENTKEEWKAVENFQGYGNDIYSINIDDLDNDNANEIMITWSYSGITGGYVLSVYGEINGMEIKELTTQSCDSSDIIDIDADGQNEIFLISSATDSGVVKRTANALKLTDGKFKTKGKVAVDPAVIAYNSVVVESTGETTPPLIYIDALKSDNQMITEVIVWDDKSDKLTAPLCDEITGTNSLSLRYEQISCSDINDDGKIEIPVQSPYYDENEDQTESSDLYLTEWMYFSGSDSVTVEKTLVNVQDGYMINLDKTGVRKIGVKRYSSRNCWIVYIDDGVNKTGNELFSILRVSDKRWSGENMSNYIKIFKDSDGVVCVYPTEKGRKMGYDETKLTNMIEAIN